MESKSMVGKFKNLMTKVNGGSILVILLTFILGWQLGHKDYQLKVENYRPNITITNQQPTDQNVKVDFKLFWDTWNLVSQKYIDKKAIDPQKLYYGAISGMVAAIGDPYTVFLPPQSQKSTKEQLSGSFEGVGIQLGYNKDKRLVVIAPLKGTPADIAGVKPADIILKINDKESAYLSLPEAVSLIRGQKGTAVSLSILGENDTKPRDVKIVRDTITVKTVELEIKTTPHGKTIGYIRLSGFGENTKKEWDEVVSRALASHVSGVVVDVRNNPGGFLDAAIYVASEFLTDGKVVLQEDALGNRQEQGVVRLGKMANKPLVVLINKGSASASEILAGALQDHKRATLVGVQSFGKGTIQSAEDLDMGTGIHITTAKWLTPNGRWVHSTGLTPDVTIELEDSNAETDPQLDKALELLDS